MLPFQTRLTIKPWFIEQMKELVDLEEEIMKYRGKQLPVTLLTQAKKDGFSDRYLAQLVRVPEKNIREKRSALSVTEGWEPVPVSGVEDAAYYFSTYSEPNYFQDFVHIYIVAGTEFSIGNYLHLGLSEALLCSKVNQTGNRFDGFFDFLGFSTEHGQILSVKLYG